MYLKKGGAVQDTGRKCLCNALFANIGMPQRRKDGTAEQPALTLGQDLLAPRTPGLYPDGRRRTSGRRVALA